MASLCRLFLPRRLTLIAIALPACRQTSCKRNAISLARTLMSGSINRACFTLNGPSPMKNRLKRRPSPKRPSRITRVSNVAAACERHKRFAQRTGYSLSKIMRLASDELFVDEGLDVVRFDQNDIVRILDFAFDK